METRRMVLLFAIATMAALSLIASGCTQNGSSQSQGRVVFTVADAAANMGAVTSVKVTVDSLQVHSTANGWVIVSSSPRTYDLLQLRASGNQSLLADTKLEPGTYGQVRMHISKVIIADSYGEHEAKLPSGDLKIVGGFVAKNNSTTAVTFDFLADKSVHVTGNGKYILAPVVRMQERQGAQVDASSQANVRINGGRMGTDTEFGMDEYGNVGVGLKIAPGLNLSISENGNIVGNDNDEHGCKASAGYSWCGVLQKCLRTWEENCTNAPRACTEEAKICPDGSAVGRQGPNCEFAPCPPTNYTLYGRVTIGPLCPAEPCSRTFDYSGVRVNVYDAASKTRVARVSADSNGYYRVKLEPGNYLVNVTDTAGNSFGLPRLDYTQSISIREGHVIEMGFDIDTGIR